MSTDRHGIVAVIGEAAAETQVLLDDREDQLRQLELEDPLTGEEWLQAKQDMGMGATRLSILAKARENRIGRPPGAKNKSTEDMRRYLLQFGSDPLVGAMRLQSENTLVLAELLGCKPIEALDRQLRARELVTPYMHGKKPVAVDVSFSGLADLIIAGVTHSHEEVDAMVDGQFIDVIDEKDAAA